MTIPVADFFIAGAFVFGEPSSRIERREKLLWPQLRGKIFALNARVAQLAEHIHGKDGVNGSSPFAGSARRRSSAVRAHGSYPWSRWFKSTRRYTRPPL